MNHCRKCQSDYEKPGTCNCFAPAPQVVYPQTPNIDVTGTVVWTHPVWPRCSCPACNPNTSGPWMGTSAAQQ
jgi:hypothetical protein